MGNDLEPEFFDAVLRTEFEVFVEKVFASTHGKRPYVPNWHVKAIAHALKECLDGKIRRLLITMPPRSLKSTCMSVAFPAFALGHYPEKRIVCASYGSDLASKLSRECRDVMQSPWYRQAFPLTRIDGRKNTEMEFETTWKGFRLATSVGGSLTGRGGDIIIVDDPIKGGDGQSETVRRGTNEWLENTLYSRLDDKGKGVIILVMQRLHIDDPVGYLLPKDDWVHLNFPATAEVDVDIPIGPNQWHHRKAGDLLHPARENQDVLDGLRRAMGTYLFSAQYQQQPIPPQGNIIKLSWFGNYEAVPPRQQNGQIVQSWDTASKGDVVNDWSVCTTWLLQGGNCYLTDVYRAQMDYPAIRKAVIDQAKLRGAQTILIEDKGSGTPLLQDLKKETGLWLVGINPDGDKQTRVSACSAMIEAGKVLLPQNAPWLGELRKELALFPASRNDDQVDSVSQFLNWVRNTQGRGPRIS